MMHQIQIITTPEQFEDILGVIVAKAVSRSLTATPVSAAKKRLLSPDDVAKEFGIHKRCLERWRGEGVGPAYSILGRRVYYEREILEAWIVANRIQTSGMATRPSFF